MCCCFLKARTQEYSYKHYEIKDGLVGNTVYQTVEDRDGFLWFATETGVSRFDGTSFKNFTTTEGLVDNEILKLFVDSRNRVWMMPFKNALCYYYKGKIYNAENDSTLKQIKISEHVVDVSEDLEGNIIFFLNKAIHVLKPDNRIIQKSLDEYSILFGGGIDNRKTPYTFLHLYPRSAELYKIIVGPDTISFQKENDSIKFNGNKWNFSYITPRLFIYLNNYHNYSDYNHLIFNNYIKHHIDTISLPLKFNIISILNDSILFFNTGYGALEFNYKTSTYKDEFLGSENISCTLQDHEGNLWFTTLGNGVYRLRSRVNRNLFFNKNDLNNSIESILATGTKIIVGTDKSKVFELIKNGDKITFYKDIHGNNETVVKIAQYNGKIYVLGESSLNRLDPGSEKLLNIPISDNPKEGLTFKDMDISGKSELFFATHIKIFSLSDENKTSNDFILQRATSVCVTDSGIYTGGLAGLKFVNWKKEVFDLGEKFPVLRSRITKLLLFKNKIWIGTNDNGVVCYDGKRIEKSISVKNGLTGNLIRALYANDNYLWVGTDHGLNKISLADTSYPVLQQYTISDGFPSNMINAVNVQDNTVYVGTPKGLSFFNDPEMQNSSNCEIRILGITVSGKEIQFDSSKLLLKNKDNNIRFDFVAISFKSEGNIIYYYKLSGIDSEWKTTRENFLQYPTLPSGQYNLELYAVNKFGVKSKLVTILFEIEKKIFEETWVIILIILAAVAIALFLANWRIRTIKRSQNEKAASAEKISRLEQQALKAQMNPHFIFNCLNSIQQYVIDKDIQGANRFISGFAKLIRQTLDNSGKQSITVAEEESFLRSYLELEKSRFEDKFDYSISIDKNIQKDEDSLPPMLLQPYIENCIRHGIMHKSDGKGIIDIRFNLSDEKLVCSVTDNGIGRKAADNFKGIQDINYQSKGTDITWQRIKMINKDKDTGIILQTEDLMDSNQQACGTKVTIVIPLQKAD